MNIKGITLLAALFLIIAIVGLCGCDCDDDTYTDSTDDDDGPFDDDDDDDDNDDDDDDDDTCDESVHDPLIVLGKESIGDQDPETAYDYFVDAVSACPNSADAQMGMIIADFQWILFWIHETFDSPPTGPDGTGPALQEIVESELMPLAEDCIELADALSAEAPKTRFYLSKAPMWYQGEHLALEMPGEWDIYDAANAEAFAQVVLGVSKILLSLNMAWDDQLFANNPLPDGSDIFTAIGHYADLLLQMYDDPNYDAFLTLETGGDVTMSEAGVALGQGLFAIKGNVFGMRDEVDDQEDDVAGYVDENDNGQWDPGEPFKLPFFGAMSRDTNLLALDLFYMIEALGKSILDGGPGDINPDRPDWFWLSKLNFILELTDVLDPTNPIRLPPIPLPVGVIFYHVGANGWRTLAEVLTEVLANLSFSL